MDITSTKCRFRSSEAAQTRHTCHSDPVSARELWQLCLAYARYQSSFSLSLTKLSSVAPVETPGLLNSLPTRAQDTLATVRFDRLRTTPGPGPSPDAAQARPSRRPVQSIGAKGQANQSRTPAPKFHNRITRGGHAA